MRVFLFLALMFLHVNASSLLTYNVYDRNDRVDIMLSFDAPYEGQIFQQKDENVVGLILQDLNYDRVVNKNINSEILQEFSINPSNNTILLNLKSNKPIGVFASKTIDGFGLRIRVKSIAPTVTQVAKNIQKTPIQTKTQTTNEYRYYSVLVVMFLLVLVLFWAKRKLKNYKPKKGVKSWLSKDNDDIKLLSEKIIDHQNKIILVQYKQIQYLVLSGTNNIILDKFSENKISSQDEFSSVFEQNKQKLDEYLKLKATPNATQLDSYKQKASMDFTLSDIK